MSRIRNRDTPAFPTSPEVLRTRAEVTADPNIVEGGYTKLEQAVILFIGEMLSGIPIEKLTAGNEKRIVKTAFSVAHRAFDELERAPEKKRKMDSDVVPSFEIDLEERP